MIVIPPDAQPIHLNDWSTVADLLAGKQLEETSLKTAYSLTYTRQPSGEFRVAPIPLSIHATEGDARKAARVYMARGRVFTISQIPVIPLSFGRYSVMMTVENELDWNRFLSPDVAIEGNVLTPECFKVRAPLITSRAFDELAPVLKQRLQPAHQLAGCLALADNAAPWDSWTKKGARTWWSSEARRGNLYWYQVVDRYDHPELPDRVLARVRQDLSRWDDHQVIDEES